MHDTPNWTKRWQRMHASAAYHLAGKAASEGRLRPLPAGNMTKEGPKHLQGHSPPPDNAQGCQAEGDIMGMIQKLSQR